MLRGNCDWLMRCFIFASIFLQAVDMQRVSAQTLPPGFVVENAFPTTTFPSLVVQVLFFPDGRKLVVQRWGVVSTMAANGTQLPTPFIDLTSKVLVNGDRGLLGAALDPDFAVNRWVYFLYVVDPDSDDNEGNSSAFSRVERYQASSSNPNVADLSTRQILIGGSWPTGIPDPAVDGSHTIGTLRFGRDKSLLLGAGDAAHFGTTDAGGLDAGAFGSGKTPIAQDIGAFRAQSLNSLCGKILRVDKETGFGLPSNPYWDGNPTSARSRVWAYGLRNPFRFNVRPGTGSTVPSDGRPGALYIGDVGWDTYEELNIARQGGVNFGWPCNESPSVQPNYAAVTSTASPNPNVLCSAPLNSENPAPRTSPELWWNHGNPNDSKPLGWKGSCSIGGSFYTASAYPLRYRNSYFIADYSNDWIRSVRVDTNDNVISGSDTLFATAAGGPVSIEVDPLSGDLFYCALDAGKVYRIRYPSGNRNPVVSASITPTYGLAPLLVAANAAASDPDGDSLRYKWDFGNGDSSLSANTTYTYLINGIYDIRITVTDGKGGSAVSAFNVVVGQLAPPGQILVPLDSSVYNADATVPLVATQVDTTAGSVTYKWDVDLLHDTHIHPSYNVLSGRNSSFVLTIPQDGGYYRYRARLSVTQGALTTRDTAVVFGSVLLQAKVFLEGPYVSGAGEMSTSLKTNGYIPAMSPYLEDPRVVSAIPADVTDWVLVQLRKGMNGSPVASKSAFLRKDGRIVGDDGTTVQITIPARPESYYVIVKHRNHLSVMSAIAIALNNTTTSLYDFTTSQAQAAGTNPMKQAAAGVFVMYAGDCNRSGIITAADANAVYGALNTTGYNLNDADMNGTVNATDANKIFSNINVSTFVP